MRKQTLHPYTAAINDKQKHQSKHLRRDALLWLTRTFPQAFDNTQRIRPLKLGIMHDILQHTAKAAEAGISKSKLREAVVLFTRRIDYLACLKAREMRIDLDGNEAGLVTEEDAERAAVKIKKRIEKNLKNIRKTAPLPSNKGTMSKWVDKQQGGFNADTQATSQQVARAPAVMVKHKTNRQYDPTAVARLKEKLGLSRRETEKVE